MVSNRRAPPAPGDGDRAVRRVLRLPDLRRRARRDARCSSTRSRPTRPTSSATPTTTTGSARRSSPRSPRQGRLRQAAPEPADLVGGLQHRRGAVLDRPEGPRAPAAARRLEARRCSGTDLSGAALEAARPAATTSGPSAWSPAERNAGATSTTTRPAGRWTAQAGGPRPGHLEVAQPAPAADGGAVRLHLSQECADLFRCRTRSRPSSSNLLAALAEGGYLVVGPTEGIYSMLGSLDQAQALALPASRPDGRSGGTRPMSGFDLSSCCRSTSTRPTSRSRRSTRRSCASSRSRPTTKALARGLPAGPHASRARRR